ncbi:MAG: hypothetical protein N3A62_10150 [Thermodesulfovibrionales bacterium]|nr:hypothetical protein [Thermodesulfovibrionales bacterium]
MTDNKRQNKEKIKNIKTTARKQLPLKNLQTKKIPSKKKEVLEEILKDEMKEDG